MFCTPQESEMCNKLDLSKKGKLKKYARIPITHIFQHFSTSTRPVVFLSHQKECPLNYAHFEALWLGFPLVHNSEDLHMLGLGYYYPHNCIQTAVKLLLRAASSHHLRDAKCLQHDRGVLTTNFDPQSPSVSKNLLATIQAGFERHRTRILNMPGIFDIKSIFADKLLCTVLCNRSQKGIKRGRQLDCQFSQPQFSPSSNIRFLFGPLSTDEEVKTFFGDGSHGSSETVCASLMSVKKALQEFLQTNHELLLLMKDDVAFAHNIRERLLLAISSWLTNSIYQPHGLLRIGYFPRSKISVLKRSAQDKNSSDMNPWPHRKSKEFPTGWERDVIRTDLVHGQDKETQVFVEGAQATVFTRFAAASFLEITKGDSAMEILSTLDTLTRATTANVICNSLGCPSLSCDSILSLHILGTRSFVYPPLAIAAIDVEESDTVSDNVLRWGYAACNGFLDLKQYFQYPRWDTMYQTQEQEQVTEAHAVQTNY
jgi:hypothetical protein